MALFPGGAHDAIQAGIAIQESIRAFNQERERTGHEPITVGIGVHAGLLMLGVIGEDERLEGTVISDAVNLASRLEGLTSVYGCSLLVSDAALQMCPEMHSLDHRPIAHVKVKGRMELTYVHEILNAEDQGQYKLKCLTKQAFLDGVRLFRLGMLQEALDCFDQVLCRNPLDNAAKVLREEAVSCSKAMSTSKAAT